MSTYSYYSRGTIVYLPNINIFYRYTNKKEYRVKAKDYKHQHKAVVNKYNMFIKTKVAIVYLKG